MEKKRAFFKSVLKLSDVHLLEELEQVSKFRKWEKGDIITKIGDINSNVDFLVEGLIRAYYLDLRGREVTDCLENIPGTPIVSCLGVDRPSPVYFEFLENSVTISIPLQILRILLYSNREMMFLYNSLLQIALQRHWETKMVLSQYAAEERYKWFLEKYPGLIDCINHKYIASFLGITSVSLSRVRGRLKQISDNEKNIYV